METKKEDNVISLEDIFRKERVKTLQERLNENKTGLQNLMCEHLKAHLAIKKGDTLCP